MVTSSDLLLFIKEDLSFLNSSMEIDSINVETDLIEFGIESIQLLQLIVKIESKFGISLSLEKLSNNCFKFSVNTLLSYVD